MAKDIDWSSLGFGYVQTDKRFVANFKDGKWDDGCLTEDGNVIEDYDGMEFYVIETASGKKFYMVIDKAQSDNNAYLLSEASEADLLNFTGTESLVLPKNAAVIAGAYKNEDGSDEVKYKAGEFNSSPNAIDGDEEVPVKKSNNNNMIMIGVIAVLFAAVAIMMKKKKKTGTKNDDEVLKDDSLDDLYEKEVSDDD